MIDEIPLMSSVRSRLAVAASRMEGGELNTLLNDAIREIELLQTELKEVRGDR